MSRWSAAQMLEHKKNCAKVTEFCNDCVHFGRGYCMVAVEGKQPQTYTDDFIIANCKDAR